MTSSFMFQGKAYETDRVIGRIEGKKPGPKIVFTAALHGNEPAGVIALQQLFQVLETVADSVTGEVIGLAGNLAALKTGQRFIWRDLNRIWNRKNTQLARESGDESFAEQSELGELRELLALIDPVLNSDSKKIFVDLHTTSSDSAPFAAINDQLANRKFVADFPMPVVLGIEEYLAGPLLSYLNEFGNVAFAFEAGQHDSEKSVDGHLAFAWMALVRAGIISAEDVPDYSTFQKTLEDLSTNPRGFFEVLFRQAVAPADQFSMDAGFWNFQQIKKLQPLGKSVAGIVRAPLAGRIFMPLYQPQGEDGFFVVNRVPKWALGLSVLLRKMNFDRMLSWLPGITMDRNQPETLVVNKRIAKYFAREVFHLLGYRRKKLDGDFMRFSRREIPSD